MLMILFSIKFVESCFSYYTHWCNEFCFNTIICFQLTFNYKLQYFKANTSLAFRLFLNELTTQVIRILHIWKLAKKVHMHI